METAWQPEIDYWLYFRERVGEDDGRERIVLEKEKEDDESISGGNRSSLATSVTPFACVCM